MIPASGGASNSVVAIALFLVNGRHFEPRRERNLRSVWQHDGVQHASPHHGVPAWAASDSWVFDNVVCRLLADPVIAIAAIPGACQTLGDYFDNRLVRRLAFVTSRSNCPLLLA